MKTLFAAVLVATCVGACEMAAASPIPAADGAMRAAGNPPILQIRLERHPTQARPRHARHPVGTSLAASPSPAEVGKVYQDGSYTYTIGPDGRRWYEPTICNCGPQ